MQLNEIVQISSTLLSVLLITVSLNATAELSGKLVEESENLDSLTERNAMSCFIHYQWFENSIVAKENNIPFETVYAELDNEFGQKPRLKDWRESAELSFLTVYSGKVSKKDYAKLGNIMMSHCLRNKELVPYKDKFSSCIKYANLARIIFLEKNRGASIEEVQKKLNDEMEKLSISKKIISDIYATDKNPSTYRMSIWAGCASNIKN